MLGKTLLTSRVQCIHVRVRPLRTPPRPSNRWRRVCRCFRPGGLCRTASPRKASAPWLDQQRPVRKLLQPLVERLPVERQRLEARPALLLVEPAAREQQPHRVDPVVWPSRCGALVQVASATAQRTPVDPVAPSTAGGGQSHREVQSVSEVQNKVSGWELAELRPVTGPARRRDFVAVPRRDGGVATVAVGSTGRAEEILRPLDRNGADAPAGLPVAPAPSGGLLAVGAVVDERRS